MKDKRAEDDPLLGRVAALAAEEEAVAGGDEELGRLAHGQLGDRELAALQARAAADPALARAVEAHRPLGAEARAATVQAALAALRPGSARPAARSRTGLWWLLAPAVLAAVVALLLPAPPWRSRAGRGELPTFALEVSGGNEILRGPPAGPGAPLRLTPDAPLAVLLRPSAAAAGVGARAFLLGADGWQELSIAPEVSGDGVVRWKGTTAALLGAGRGAFTLALLVGWSALVAGDGAQLVRLPETSGPGWQRLAIAIELPGA